MFNIYVTICLAWLQWMIHDQNLLRNCNWQLALSFDNAHYILLKLDSFIDNYVTINSYWDHSKGVIITKGSL